jgi:hypothetical protein
MAFKLVITDNSGKTLHSDTFVDYKKATSAFNTKVTFAQNNRDYGRAKDAPLTEVAPPKGDGGDATSPNGGSENYMDLIKETETVAPPTPVAPVSPVPPMTSSVTPDITPPTPTPTPPLPNNAVKWSYEKSNRFYSGGSKPTQTVKRTAAQQTAFEKQQDTAAAKPVTAPTAPTVTQKATQVVTEKVKDKNFMSAALVAGGLYYLATR